MFVSTCQLFLEFPVDQRAQKDAKRSTHEQVTARSKVMEEVRALRQELDNRQRKVEELEQQMKRCVLFLESNVNARAEVGGQSH